MAAPLKILAVGDVDGKIDKLFKKVAKTQEKSKFDVLLCSGSFFGPGGEIDASWDDYVSGKLKVPIDTYVLGPKTPEQLPKYSKVKRGGDLCENVTYLGQQGVYVMPNGLKLGYLSGGFHKGLHDMEDLPEPRIAYSKADVDAIVNFAGRPSYSGVDVFLCSQWPSGICKGAKNLPTDQTGPTSDCPGSAASASALKPRYHFSGGSPEYFERAPYSNNTPGLPPTNASRFYGLAPVGNAAKQKWLYACNVVPMSKADRATVMAVPTGLTPSPYATTGGRPTTDSFFFGEQKQRGGSDQRKRKREGQGQIGPPRLPPGVLPPTCPPALGAPRPPRPPRPPAGPCWFCLMSPDVEKHLVTSVGTKVYMALAKGGLVPEHAMILPIQHIPASTELEEDALNELIAYKTAMREMFKAQGKACVFWERNFRSQHLQVQVCPVPLAAAEHVEQAFRDRGTALKPDFAWQKLEADASLPEGVTAKTPYFVVGLPDGSQLYHRASKGFPLQFAREALASEKLLSMPDRIDWKACKIDKETETAQAKEARNVFKPFAPE